MPLLLPYFKFNVQDWITSEFVLQLNGAQTGAYIMLLSHCWVQSNCTLPTDRKILRQLARFEGSDEALEFVLKAFMPRRGSQGRLTNRRLYAEWEQAMGLTMKLKESGLKGAEKRWAPKPSTIPLTNGVATWASYAQAYKNRYHVEPVRNRTVNSHLKQLVDRLGTEEAPHVAAFYLTHNKPFYVTARHPTNLLIRDAEGLRTEWATGVKSTTLEARSAEVVDQAQEQIKRVGKILEGRRHETA